MNAVPSPRQGGPGDETDPSMEEILASIRRIIADEHGAPIPSRPGGPDAYRPKSETRSDYADRMPRFEPSQSRPASPAQRAPSDSALRPDRLERAPDRPMMRPASAGSPRPPAPRATFGGGERLMSPEADASVASAFDRLSRSLSGSGPGSMDETVREMLRPMLRQWLDDNLPTLVERLVRAEIERVSRGR